CYVLAYALSNFKAANKIYSKKISIDLRSDATHLFFELSLILLVFSFTSYFVSFGNPQRLQTREVILESKNSAVIFICTMTLLVYRSLKFADFGPHRQSVRKNCLFISIFILCVLFSIVVVGLIFSGNQAALSFFQVKKLSPIDIMLCGGCLFVSILVTVLFDFYERMKRKEKAR
ncbi:uncharacterized protein VICG_01425, partial [Vittaforma corneae ATCC 50505]